MYWVLMSERSDEYELSIDGHIFRLSEFLPILIISDSLKTALIQNNVTGFKIYKPELFSL